MSANFRTSKCGWIVLKAEIKSINKTQAYVFKVLTDGVSFKQPWVRKLFSVAYFYNLHVCGTAPSTLFKADSDL